MNEQTLFILANQTLHQVVKHITEADLDRIVTKDMSMLPNQSLRATLNIFAYENFCVPEVLNGKKDLVTNAEFKEDLLKEDFQTNYAQYSDAANQAAKNLADPERIVHISYGDFPAKKYLSDVTIQRGFGAYDLAIFLQIDPDMPDKLVQGMWQIIQPIAEQLREYQVFGPEIKVPADAPLLDRLLGLSGRRVS